MDINVDTGTANFTVRTAAVFVHDGHVLLHQSDGDTLWNLPGGRVQVLERTEDALRREMLEELGDEITVGPLQWVVESFFTDEGRHCHEIGFYYLTAFRNPDRYDKSKAFRGRENTGRRQAQAGAGHQKWGRGARQGAFSDVRRRSLRAVGPLEGVEIGGSPM